MKTSCTMHAVSRRFSQRLGNIPDAANQGSNGSWHETSREQALLITISNLCLNILTPSLAPDVSPSWRFLRKEGLRDCLTPPPIVQGNRMLSWGEHTQVTLTLPWPKLTTNQTNNYYIVTKKLPGK